MISVTHIDQTKNHSNEGQAQDDFNPDMPAIPRSGLWVIVLSYCGGRHNGFCADKLWLLRGNVMSKYKPYLSYLYLIVLFLVGYHRQPIETVVFAIFFGLVILCLGLRIYFMPVKTRLENIAKLKARHGILMDQPHKVDGILKSGYFRVP